MYVVERPCCLDPLRFSPFSSIRQSTERSQDLPFFIYFGGLEFARRQIHPQFDIMYHFIKVKYDPRGIRTPSLWIWNPTRCRCAMESPLSSEASTYGLVGYDVRLTRGRSPVRSWVGVSTVP